MASVKIARTDPRLLSSPGHQRCQAYIPMRPQPHTVSHFGFLYMETEVFAAARCGMHGRTSRPTFCATVLLVTREHVWSSSLVCRPQPLLPHNSTEIPQRYLQIAHDVVITTTRPLPQHHLVRSERNESCLRCSGCNFNLPDPEETLGGACARFGDFDIQRVYTGLCLS